MKIGSTVANVQLGIDLHERFYSEYDVTGVGFAKKMFELTGKSAMPGRLAYSVMDMMMLRVGFGNRMRG